MKKRHLPPESYQNVTCFTLEELRAYRDGGLHPEARKAVFGHLNRDSCPRCVGLYDSLESAPPRTVRAKQGRRRAAAPTPSFSPRQYAVPIRIASGQIWTTVPNPKTAEGRTAAKVKMARPVLVVSPGTGEKRLGNVIRVMPLSLDLDYHVPGEDVVVRKDSPLRYPFLVESWNEREMLAGNLGAYRGMLCDRDRKRVEALRSAAPLPKGPPTDAEVESWRMRERELTDYLSAAAAAASAFEPTVIVLEKYAKAADTGGIALHEINPHPLYQSADFSLFVVQVRDAVILRLLSDKLRPRSLRLNGETVKMKRAAVGCYDAEVGTVETVPASLRITLNIGGKTFTFHARFSSEHGP